MSETVEQNAESSRNGKLTRAYFENSCLCIANGEIAKQPPQTPDWNAVEFYHKNCKCTRNYPAAE